MEEEGIDMSINSTAAAVATGGRERPVHEVRIGTIKAAIWKNETENGVRYNATVSRIYRDGDNWKSTDSFGRDDLLVVAKVLDCAHSWICDQQQQQHHQSPSQPEFERDPARPAPRERHPTR